MLLTDMQKLITSTWNVMIKTNKNHVLYLGSKQPVWLGDVTKATYKWISISSKYFWNFLRF